MSNECLTDAPWAPRPADARPLTTTEEFTPLMRLRLTRAATALALTSAALSACLAASAAALPAQLLTFEGVGNDNAVDDFYASLGVTFTPNAFALTRTNAGGSGNFGGAPSSSLTALVFSDFPGAPTYLNVAGGFTTGLGLFYSAPAVPVMVRVWSGLDASGDVLATLMLGATPNGSVIGCPPNPGATFCPFAPAGVAFAGTARSVDFGGALNDAVFDNVTLGQVAPAVVPEPATVLLVAAGLLGVAGAGARRRRRESAARSTRSPA